MSIIVHLKVLSDIKTPHIRVIAPVKMLTKKITTIIERRRGMIDILTHLNLLLRSALFGGALRASWSAVANHTMEQRGRGNIIIK